MDYRGRLTGERFYRAGQAVEFPDNVATQLVRRGRAVEVVEADSPAHNIDIAADEIDLDHLTYRELQALAKKHDIPANQSRDDLIEALS